MYFIGVGLAVNIAAQLGPTAEQGVKVNTPVASSDHTPSLGTVKPTTLPPTVTGKTALAGVIKLIVDGFIGPSSGSPSVPYPLSANIETVTGPAC